MLALLMVKKGILNTTSSLILANTKFFYKNLSLLFLFDTEKVETIIL